ncbi:MAG: hypothetical protein ABIJ57_12835 [Pseudomonadota bacterium]
MSSRRQKITPITEKEFSQQDYLGISQKKAREDHTHGTPINPVDLHKGEDDPHAQYRLESEDHSHEASGVPGGKLDHGKAMVAASLRDDDHTQYIKHSLATAISDFLVASGAGVFIKKTLAEVKAILGLGTAAYTASTDYAPAAQGVTNGNSHDHVGGDGAQIDHGGLAGLVDDDHTQYVLVNNSRMATGHYRYAAALADTGTITLPTITGNWPAHGFIHCAHAATGVISESAEFEYGSTGAVQIIRGTANIEANGATVGKISLGPAVAANPVVIKNNLGGGVSVNAMVTLWYK